MSKNQHKMGKIIDILQKIRSSFLIQRLNVYKPCLLIVDINGTSLALVSNDEILGHFTYRQNSRSYTQIKSCLTMYLKCCKFPHEDIAARICHWEIKNPRTIKFLTGIGLKVSALHKIYKTRMLIYMAMLDDNNEVMSKHTKAAWKNCNVGECA
ncbi:hypothetical protein [Bartonella taylorii]|uniref:hypothetical protein n=1 Tax=Bartonella taylorii TaxID=33046 RepID=UPI001ABB235C|nr:hypothetical protein [Bartonella taylorii]